MSACDLEEITAATAAGAAAAAAAVARNKTTGNSKPAKLNKAACRRADKDSFFLVPFLIDPNLTRSHTFFLNKLALFLYSE